MLHESEFKELSDYVDKLEEKHENESFRQDNTTWALQDLIKIIRKMTKESLIHEELDNLLADILKNC